MKEIKVLGTGCATCQAVMTLIQQEAASDGIELQCSKIEDIAEIMGYGVMSTPGVVVNGTLVHSGGMPSLSDVRAWLRM